MDNECQLHGEFKQCCCNCQYLAAVHYHCTIDHGIREATGGCVCGIQKGWACIGFISQPDPRDGPVRIHDNWTEHSVGCEMYMPRPTAEQAQEDQ